MEPTNREIYLTGLANSDEDVESLLSGGADVDTLIEAGVLDDGEGETIAIEGVEPGEESLDPVDQTPLSEGEVQSLIDSLDTLLEKWPPMEISSACQKKIAERGSRNASSNSH